MSFSDTDKVEARIQHILELEHKNDLLAAEFHQLLDKALALVLGRVLPNFEIPLWVILLCALTMGIGTSFGGWRIIRRIGMQMVELAPWQGFSAEMGASLAILGASSLGIPLSTTHTIATSIMGVAASRRMSAVRWGIAQEEGLFKVARG